MLKQRNTAPTATTGKIARALRQQRQALVRAAMPSWRLTRIALGEFQPAEAVTQPRPLPPDELWALLLSSRLDLEAPLTAAERAEFAPIMERGRQSRERDRRFRFERRRRRIARRSATGGLTGGLLAAGVLRFNGHAHAALVGAAGLAVVLAIVQLWARAVRCRRAWSTDNLFEASICDRCGWIEPGDADPCSECAGWESPGETLSLLAENTESEPPNRVREAAGCDDCTDDDGDYRGECDDNRVNRGYVSEALVGSLHRAAGS